ncbi:hypothetical protein PSHT_13815 [Puccinia striiformis]|uniref:Peptidase S53 domain-containing protein n=1 Tax=Puccinia striiformis TaxID=27350 RepID=A0A2S4UNJ3_9BASI|nr:hypothetical protein PSHT_13815 [Puccinia striiformis]
MSIINSLLIFLFLSLVDGLVHETRRPHPLWKRTDGSGATIPDYLKHQARLPIKFRLRQNNVNRLHDELMRVSDPENESYGKFWSPQQVSEFFAPSPESHQAVLDWLYSHEVGIKSDQVVQDHQRGWIEFRGTIKQRKICWKRLTTFTLTKKERAMSPILISDYSIRHGNFVGCESYNLPDHLAQHIEMVTPTVHFPSDRKAGHASTSPTGPPEDVEPQAFLPQRHRRRWHGISKELALTKCSEWMSSTCLSHIYKFLRYTPVAAAKNSIGIVMFSPMKLIFSGTDLIYHDINPKVFGARPRVTDLGPHTATAPAQQGKVKSNEDELFELEMTVEYSLPLVYPTPVDIYQVRVHSTESIQSFEPLFEAVLCKQPGGSGKGCVLTKPANVLVITYGMSEISSPRAALVRQCEEYAKMGLMGISVIVASGDNGVAGHEGQCIGSSQKLERGARRFAPDFPASCPHVTSIGGTMIPAGQVWNYPEIAMNYDPVVTGGGFSDVFPVPSYQKAALENYYRKNKPSYPKGVYNDSMQARGYPDLSVNGCNFAISHWNPATKNATFYKFRGTSLSAPVAASIITLVNDGRIAKGMQPVGFINPSIYSPKFASAFNDIVQVLKLHRSISVFHYLMDFLPNIRGGTNNGCGTPGFSAAEGWDPVTGML